MQRVIERAEVGIDLLAQRAGQKAKALTGFHRRAGQDDPSDLFGLQRLHSFGHREIGLTGAGRADAEHDGVDVDGIDVMLLVERLGPDGLSAPGQDVQGQHLRRGGVVLAGHHGDAAAHQFRRQALAAGNDGDQFGHHPFGQCHIGGLAGESDGVTADVDVGGQPRLQGAKVLIGGTQQADDQVGRNRHAAAHWNSTAHAAFAAGGARLAGAHQR